MPTEKTQLPDFVIASLYTDLLILGNDVETRKYESSTAIENIAVPIIKTAPVKTEKTEPKPAAVPPTKPIAAKPVVIVSDSTEKQWYLGNNGKKITILIKEADVAFVNDQHLQLLSNILNACKLNLGDIALVNHFNTALVYNELKQKVQPKFIIAFDLQTKEIQLPFTIPNYQVQVHDNCKFLFASSLKTMEGDSQEAKMEKSKLWASLKNMFQL
jgi:hypothetical protein